MRYLIGLVVLVLGFAATLRARPIDELWEISRLDEIWQAEQWGDDDEAIAMAARKKADFLHADFMFTLCCPDAPDR